MSMKRVLLALLIIVVVFPFTSLAEQGFGWHFLQMRADERRQQRLRARGEEASGEYYRMGRNVFQNLFSPRRRRITQVATVTGVVDGSIVIVDSKQEIRLLGAGAPEIIRDGVECYGQEARNGLKEFLLNKEVVIEREETYQKDSYNRLVRYLRLGSQDVNAWMIWNGYAFADNNHPHEREKEYSALEQRAKENERGIWSYLCDYNDSLDEVEVLQ